MSRKRADTNTGLLATGAASDVEPAHPTDAAPSEASAIDDEYHADPWSIAIAALKRALKLVEAKADKASPAEASYGVDLNVAIRGDLVVGKPLAPGEPQTVCDFTDAELVAGLVAWIPKGKLNEALSSAVGMIAVSRRNGAEALEAKQELKSAQIIVEQLVPGIAKRRAITREHRRPGRAGSVTGKPTVRITGSVDEQSVSISVA